MIDIVEGYELLWLECKRARVEAERPSGSGQKNPGRDGHLDQDDNTVDGFGIHILEDKPTG